MTWTYRQSDGELMHDGEFAGTGYSGTGVGRNNPKRQEAVDLGPVPTGEYEIGPPYDDDRLGPCVMHLDPTPSTETFGRSLFRIHGNNAINDASHGCIILGPSIRHLIAASGDCVLIVTP